MSVAILGRRAGEWASPARLGEGGSARLTLASVPGETTAVRARHRIFCRAGRGPARRRPPRRLEPRSRLLYLDGVAAVDRDGRAGAEVGGWGGKKPGKPRGVARPPPALGGGGLGKGAVQPRALLARPLG